MPVPITVFLAIIWVGAHVTGLIFSSGGGSDFAEATLALSPLASASSVDVHGGDSNHTIVFEGATFVFASRSSDGDGYVLGRKTYTVEGPPSRSGYATSSLAGRPVVTVPIRPPLDAAQSAGDRMVTEALAKWLEQTDLAVVAPREDFFSRLPVIGGIPGAFERVGDIWNGIKTWATLDYPAFRYGEGAIATLFGLFKLVLQLIVLAVISSKFIPLGR